MASELHNHDSDLYGIPAMMCSSEAELDLGEGRNQQNDESSDSGSDCVTGFVNLLSSAVHLGKPPAHLRDEELKLLVSRGGGTDGSDDSMSAPDPALLLQDGDEQPMPKDVPDLTTLFPQLAGKKSVCAASSMATQCDQDLLEDFSFVPPLLLACLLSYDQDEHQFRRILG